MRSRSFVVAAAALALTATMAACGDDSGSGSADSDNEVTITASEYKFAIDGEPTGGFVKVEFDNAGKEPHILVALKLQDGKTAQDALPILASEEEPDPEVAAEVFDGDPFSSFYGTPGLLEPGGEQETFSNFAAGSYVLACFLPAPDGTPHAALGMVADFTVGEGDTPAPETKGTFEISDDSITAPDGVEEGVYAVNNGGAEPSDFNMLGPTDATIEEVDAAVGGFFGSIGSGEEAEFSLPAPLVAGFSDTMPPGATGYIVVDLESGRYLIGGNSDDEGNTLVSGEFEVS